MDAVQLAIPMDVEQHGEIRVYRITLPFLPQSKNVIDGWPAEWRAGVKKRWCRVIAEQVEQQMIPKGCARIGLAATLVFAEKARRDPQNYAQALWHWVPDALVKAGVVVDDDEGRIDIGRNWGLTFAYDLRDRPKRFRRRTILAITMRVPG